MCWFKLRVVPPTSSTKRSLSPDMMCDSQLDLDDPFWDDKYPHVMASGLLWKAALRKMARDMEKEDKTKVELDPSVDPCPAVYFEEPQVTTKFEKITIDDARAEVQPSTAASSSVVTNTDGSIPTSALSAESQ